MIIALILFLALCASASAQEIDWNKPPPADWPKLVQHMHYVSLYDFDTFCAPKIPNVIGCAKPYFALGRCDIYLAPQDFYLWTIDHEKGHCEGRDHLGETTLSDAWAAYKRTTLARAK